MESGGKERPKEANKNIQRPAGVQLWSQKQQGRKRGGRAVEATGQRARLDPPSGGPEEARPPRPGYGAGGQTPQEGEQRAGEASRKLEESIRLGEDEEETEETMVVESQPLQEVEEDPLLQGMRLGEL